MRVIGDAISQIRTATRQFTADAKLTDRDIFSIMLKHSKWLIAQEADKLQISEQESLFVPYNCVDIIPVPVEDECCRYTSGCKIYRTKNPLPEMWQDSKGSIIRSVTTIEWSKDLTKTTLEKWIKMSGDANFKYNKEAYFFLRNGYMYFPNRKWKSVSILLYPIFDIPPYCGECDEVTYCVSKAEENWRVPAKLEGRIIDAVEKELASLYMKVNPDESTDKNEKSK